MAKQLQKEKEVHISQTKCWSCQFLKKYVGFSSYHCPQNKDVEFVAPDFGQICKLYTENPK